VIRHALLVLLGVLALAGTAVADPEADADRAFRAASQQAVANHPAALEAFEQLGAARPVTRWTDDAWAEAGRLAERAGDYARARRAYEQAVAVSSDERLVARARSALARIASLTADGRWDAVTREHERLVSVVFGGDDPQVELAALEQLVTLHPDYPRVNAIRLALGRGWEAEGDRARAQAWLRAAADAEPAARVQLVRALIRAGALDAAEHELARVEGGDPVAVASAHAALATAKERAWIARGMWSVVALVALAAAVMFRRVTGSWRAAARRLVRPPGEVVFLIPIAAVLVVVAQTGNPLVARAVTWIVVAGVVITWISGALLDAMRARGAVPLWRLGPHVLAVVLAVGAVGYLAILRSGSLDFVLETWRAGHALR
jgi:hypothetical protein